MVKVFDNSGKKISDTEIDIKIQEIKSIIKDLKKQIRRLARRNKERISKEDLEGINKTINNYTKTNEK